MLDASALLRSPRAELALYVVAALLPWFVVEGQEQARWHGRADLVWPWFSLAVLPVLVAAAMLVGRRAGATANAAPSDPTTRRLWIFAGVVAATVALPLAVGYFRDLTMRPVSALRSDQLPFIELALRDFWRDSRFPYRSFEIAHWYEPSVYPPFLWLQYTFPYWFAVDLRTLSAASLLVLFALLFGHALLAMSRSALCTSRPALAIPVAIPFLLFALPTWRDALFMVQTPTLWMMCALLALAVRTRSWMSAGVLLALCTLSRAWFLFAIPPMLVYSFANRREMGMNGLARFWGSLTVVGLAIGLPFLLFDPAAFLENTVRSYDKFHAVTIATNPAAREGFGLSQLLAAMRLEDAAMPIAVAVQAGLFALACRRVRTEREVVRAMALNVMCFSAFAVVPFFYVYVEGLVLLAFAGMDGALESLSRRTVARARLAIAALAAVAIGGFVGAGMFARPRVVEGTSMSVAESMYLVAGFDRHGWVPRSSDNAPVVVDRHAYASVSVDYPRLTKLVLDVETAAPADGAWLEIVLNGEPIGGVSIAEAGRREHVLHIPRKNLKYGGNELALHVGGRYGDAPWNAKDLGLRVYRVHVGE